jgi:murein DD-endopeptidase MepM/ murein hydrolase activator NlpD
MEVERDEFKFPDEQIAESEKDKANEAVSDEIEVKIEDDTPEQDRGRRPLSKRTVEEIDNEDLDEYSEKVKKRLSQMKRVYHDERREKERALREKEEALRFAQAREQEIKQLKQRLGNNEQAFVKEAEKYANFDLNLAKERLKQAYDNGDSEKIADAQELLTDAKLKLQNIARVRPSLQQQEERVEQAQQVQAPQPSAQPKADPKAEAWRDKNSWFGEDEEMTALALGLHEKLVRSGVDPNSDEYYRRVDDTMRKRFPEAFEDAEEDEKPQTKQEEKPARTKPANVVAPVTRGTAPRQVRLTPTQVAIAKKLGLSNEQYARELMKLEAN